jgi:serine protease Do
MDQNNDWYERYSSQPPQDGGARAPHRSEKRGVRYSTLIVFMLVAVLLGGLLGGLYTRQYVAQQLTALNTQQAQSVQNALSEANPGGSAGLTTASTSGFASTFSKAQIIELTAPSVVGIDTYYTASGNLGLPFAGGNDSGSSNSQSQQVQVGSGSGIILTSDGYIVTCKHVVDGAETIKVILNDDTEHDAKLIGSDSRSDLAVLKIDATNLTPATLGDSDMLTVGEDVIAIGNPLGELRGTATSGIISALSREVTVESTSMSLIQTDAAISPGNSGGGLFNASGSLVGIVNAKASSSNSEGLGFAIPVSSVKTIISNLIDHGYVLGRAYLGVYTQNVTLSSDANSGSNGLFGNFFGGSTSCVQIAQIVSGSAAEQAGLKANDLILKVNDTTIDSNTTLAGVISGFNAGDTATLTIQRDGKEQTVSVTFGEYKPAEQ